MIASSTSRVSQILAASDELLRQILEWIQDRQGASCVPDSVQAALQAVVAACDKAVPKSCRALGTHAIGRLAEEYRAYSLRECGKVRNENGAPGPSFWAAVAEFARARHQAEPPQLEQFRPVGWLLKQGVSHSQIARHIYGRNGIGPFIQPNGDVNSALIEREGRESGSVIPADWIPPWHTAAVSRRQKILKRQLKIFSMMETAQKYDEPATVEELLQEGAFVQQIERVKGVSRAAVLAAAARIGVQPIDRPGYRSPAFDQAERELLDEADPPLSDNEDRQTLKESIIELYEEFQGELGAAEIAAELRQLGHDINTNSVVATIGHWKRQKRARSSGTAS